MQNGFILLVCFFMMALFVAAEAKAELTHDQLEEWFADDEREHPFDINDNDGNLVFLQNPPEQRALHSRNILLIEPRSLQSGWVKIDQCYQELDPIEKVEVVYRYKEMRDLHITRTSNIGKAWVEGQSIQLESVLKDAVLCIETEARIIYKQDDGILLLRNGPFQRRFLDSYFPMHLTLEIRYPGDLLILDNVNPAAELGFKVKAEQGLVYIDTWFEGKLMIEVEFRPAN